MKPPLENPYDVLQVPRKATKQAIRAAYRKKAAKAHPDVGGDARECARLNAAWSIVGNDAKRAEYDATGQIRMESDDLHQACAILGEIFEAMKEQIDPADPPEQLMNSIIVGIKMAIKTAIIGGEHSAKQKSRLYAAAVKKAKAMRAGLRRRKQGGTPVLENILDMMVNDGEREAAQEATKIEIKLRQLRMALEMADQYEGEEAMPRPPRQTGGSFFLDEAALTPEMIDRLRRPRKGFPTYERHP